MRRLPPYRNNEMAYLGAALVALVVIITVTAAILVATAVGVGAV
jgi:hypothetical protein